MKFRHLFAAVLMVAGLSALSAGCGNDVAQRNCADGAEGCECESSSSCSSDLVCYEGACTDPETCKGEEACACFNNGTCFEGLQCNDGFCEGCPAGDLSCGCKEDGSCNEGLVCTEETCIEPNCDEPGKTGCKCDDGSCESGARCQNDVCVACDAPGQMGCVCGEDFACKDKLDCKDGVCTDCAGEEGCSCREDGSCADGFTCNTNDVCQPCAPGARGCACNAGSCGTGLTCQSSTCQPCDGEYAGAAGCSCANSACQDGLFCGDSDVCEPCSPGKPGCRCDAGSCEVGAVCRDGTCQPCSPGEAGCACVDGSCSDGSICDADTSVCRAPNRCGGIGCDPHQACQPAQQGQDAKCLESCRPGFKWAPAAAACEPIAAANCQAGADDSILDACNMRNRSCRETSSGAECGGCTGDYTEVYRRCIMVTKCSQLDCGRKNRECMSGTNSAPPSCGACLDGFVEDPDTGECRAPKTCSDLQCAPGQKCMAGSKNMDAVCMSEPCKPDALPCNGNGETGKTDQLRTLNGNCLCETKPGYFVSEAQAFATLPCDQDTDGWVRRGAYAAVNSKDPAIKRNARCDVREVGQVQLENEKGQTKSVPLSSPLPLYETKRNDVPQYAPTPDKKIEYGANGRALQGAELNSFTKGCVEAIGPASDLNDNDVADVNEWQGQGLNGNSQIVRIFEQYTKFSYFLALARGWYEPAAGSGPGTWHIREKSRKSGASKGDRILLKNDKKKFGNYWRQCVRRPDNAVPLMSRPNRVGLDFARYQPAAGWDGMNHHSQFKCVQVIAESDYKKLGSDQIKEVPQKVTPSMLDGSHASRKDMKSDFNICEASMNLNGPVSGTKNPHEPELSCSLQSPRVGDVGWAAVHYLHYTRAKNYVRSCVNECIGYTCPSPFDDPHGVMTGRKAGDFGFCYLGCGHNTASGYPSGGPFSTASGSGKKYRMRGEIPTGSTSRTKMSGQNSQANVTYTIK